MELELELELEMEVGEREMKQNEQATPGRGFCFQFPPTIHRLNYNSTIGLEFLFFILFYRQFGVITTTARILKSMKITTWKHECKWAKYSLKLI